MEDEEEPLPNTLQGVKINLENIKKNLNLELVTNKLGS